MKKIILALCVLATVSCKKEITGANETSESLASSDVSAAASAPLNRQTNFGCIINGTFTNDQRISVAQDLNAQWVRAGVSMTEWKGSNLPYETYVNNGIGVIWNVNYEPQPTVPKAFPKDMIKYRKTFTEIVNKYQPPVIVVENEEINKNWHKGPITDYIAMLHVALDVCHAKGIKVTNGGIYGPQLEVLTYRYLQTKGQKRADSFGNNCMADWQVKAAQTPNSNENLEKDVRQLDTLLTYFVNLDYINIHVYEPFDPDIVDASKASKTTPVVIADLQEYLRIRTGRDVITNETGQRDNTNPNLVTAMMNEYDRLKFPYVMWYSGTGISGAQPLYDMGTGILNTNGQAFSNFLGAY